MSFLHVYKKPVLREKKVNLGYHSEKYLVPKSPWPSKLLRRGGVEGRIHVYVLFPDLFPGILGDTTFYIAYVEGMSQMYSLKFQW